MTVVDGVGPSIAGGDVALRTADDSPQMYARLAGFLYLYIIVAALAAEFFVRGTLIVTGDAAATGRNILASETLFRAGLAGELLTCVCDVAIAAILYILLRPANRNLALLATFMRLAFIAVYAPSKLFLVAALVLLGGAGYLQALEPEKLQALAYAAIRVHGLGYGVSLLFFGVHCALIGYLVYVCGYLPRIIGTLLVIGGLGYSAFSVVQVLDPALAARLFPWILLPAFPAELGLCLWLIVKGVDVEQWRASAAG